MMEVTYRVDADDRLVEINPEWDRFAEDNGVPQLLAGKIRNRPLFDFISDAQTALLHRALLDRVRRTRAPLFNLPFRCDAPHLRREMAMDIVPLAHDVVEFTCRVVAETPRAAIPLTHVRTHPDADALRMCSWCNRIDAGKWVELEEAVVRLPVFTDAQTPFVTHTICSACWLMTESAR